MKRIRTSCMWLLILGLLGSCFYPSEPNTPSPEPWLCSINADGTGFRKIKKAPFNTPGLVDINMTKDNRIIFYGQKLWISETDVFIPTLIVPDSLTMDNHPRISQSTSGDRLFFAANNSVYQLTIPSFEINKLSSISGNKLINPILSADDITITFLKHHQMKEHKDYSMTVSYLSIEDLVIHELPSLGQYCHNAIYRNSNSRMYYNDLYNLYSCSITGDDIQLIGSYASETSHIFGLTHDERYLLVKGSKLRIVDLSKNSHVELSVLTGLNVNLICAPVKTTDLIYYIDLSNKLVRYDMNSQTIIEIPFDYSKAAFGLDSLITANWDGSVLYFICNVTL